MACSSHLVLRCTQLPLLLLLVLLATVVSASSSMNMPAPATVPPAPAPRQQRQSSSSAVLPLLQNVYGFWLKWGPDPQFGGFHGTLDRQGTPVSPTNKFLVQHARHLWAFSALLMAEPAAKGFNSRDVRAAADSAYTFMRNNMLREVEGGRLFVYSTTREGKVANGDINIYAQAFAIYGLAAYARATGSAEARDLALTTFKTLDRLYHSSNGGYDESSAGCTLDSVPLGPGSSSSSVRGCSGILGVSPVSASSSRTTQEAGSRQPRLSQAFNTLLHVAEALTELSKATSGSDSNVTARLLEVLQLQTGPMVVRPTSAGPNTPRAYIAPNYDPRTWRPVGRAYSNYGHNIEASWLLNDGVDELQARGAIDSTKAAALRASLQDIGEAAVAAGYDNKNGGMFDGSTVGAAAPTSPNKIWWSQAEALLGLHWLHTRKSNAGAFEAKLQQTLAFVVQHLQDAEHGEWYWQVGPAGGPPLPFNAGDINFAPTVKGLAWKASYHTGRALLRLAAAGY